MTMSVEDEKIDRYENTVKRYFERNNITIDALMEEKKTNVAYILAGTGGGKSYWVKNSLAKTGRVLFVTSRKAKVLQDKDKPVSNLSFLDNFKNGITNIVCTNHALYLHIRELCKNASKEDAMKRVDAFLNGFKYVVFDEFHSFVCDSLFSRDVFNIAVFCAYCAIKKKKKTILLSATIEPVEFFIQALSQIFDDMPDTDGVVALDLRKECEYVLPETIRVIDKKKSKNDKICELLASGENIMYFMNFIGIDKKDGDGEESGTKKRKNYGYTIQQEYEFLLNYGLQEEEIAVIVSSDKQKKWDEEHNCKKYIDTGKVDEYGKPILITFNEWVRAQIVENQEIPEGVRVILCSATLNEGISIENVERDPFGYIITDAHYIASLIQQMGRLRHNLKEFWVIKDAGQHCNYYDRIEAKLVRTKIQDKALFLECLTEHAESIPDYEEREKFISWICKTKKFELVEYVYLTHRFEFNNLRYNMVDQVNRAEEKLERGDFKGMRRWQKDLENFAAEHDVAFKSSNQDRIVSDLRKIAKIREHMLPILDQKFTGEEWKLEKKRWVDLNLGKTEKTINRKLQSLGLEFSFNKGGKIHGNNVYWFSRK